MGASLTQKVQKLLDEAQPVLGLHQGGIELVKITPDHTVYLRFLGACQGCSLAEQTLNYGLKELIMLNLEEIKDVISVDNQNAKHQPPFGSPFTD
jgi:Fe-S cluster biogenesis protein NfuA